MLPENAQALDQPNSYTDLLLNPQFVVQNLVGGKEGEVALTRSQWLKERGGETALVQRPATFSIWVYGNDLDLIDGKPEHALLLRGPNGEWEPVGGVGNTESVGDGRNACFVVSGIDATRYLRGNQVELRFDNTLGGPYASRAFGFWLLPDEPNLTPTEATRRIEADLEAVRKASFAFTEYSYAGVQSREDAPMIVPVDLAPTLRP